MYLSAAAASARLDTVDLSKKAVTSHNNNNNMIDFAAMPGKSLFDFLCFVEVLFIWK